MREHTWDGFRGAIQLVAFVVCLYLVHPVFVLASHHQVPREDLPIVWFTGVVVFIPGLFGTVNAVRWFRGCCRSRS